MATKLCPPFWWSEITSKQKLYGSNFRTRRCNISKKKGTVDMEAIIYLVGNLFRLYVISRLFCIFLSAEHELIAKKNSFKFKLSLSYIRRGAFFIYYMINSLGFLVFSWPPEIIIVTNLVGMALISLTYEGNLQQRVLAIVMAMSLSIICEDLVVYILVKIGTTHIVTIGITVANMLFS